MHLYRRFPRRSLMLIELVVFLILIFTIAISLPSFGPSTYAISVRSSHGCGDDPRAAGLLPKKSLADFKMKKSLVGFKKVTRWST